MKIFHNDSYAQCDVALHHDGICSNINMLRSGSQYPRSIAFHNGQAGVGSLAQDPRGRHPGGKIGGRTERWPSPLTIVCLNVVGQIFCFPETLLEKSDG